MERHLVPAVVDLKSLVFPVFAVTPGGSRLVRPDAFGTAFCIGPGIFLTAGHVVESVRSYGGAVALGNMRGEAIESTEASAVEVIASHDLAIVQCALPAIGALAWQEEPLQLLTDVGAFGYAYAVDKREDPPRYVVAIRGFKGYVIARREIWTLPAHPVGYEVSCPFPQGHSGAPLLRAETFPASLIVVGMVVGRGKVELEETVTEYGEAIDILSICQIHSEIAGGTLADLRERVLAAMVR